MITVKEAAAAVAANQSFTRKDALDLARFALAMISITTMMLALLG